VPISLKIQAQRRNKQNHLASHKGGHVKVVIGAWDRRKSMVVKQFQTNVFTKDGAAVSEDVTTVI